MKTKLVETTIDKLIPDNINANKGTEYGNHLIEKSFLENGAGRSILIDKNNRIIAGNKSTEHFSQIGLNDIIIVETDGTKLVAVKRTDIDIDTKQGRELALSDNATSKANLAWDAEAIAQIHEQWEIKPEDWGIKADEGENDPAAEWKGMPEFNGEDQMGAKQLIVHFKTMDDYFLFGVLINQKLSEKTKSIWYPEEQRGSQTDHIYEKQTE
jgi:sporulation protein YlmC with PRC-barrel domain